MRYILLCLLGIICVNCTFAMSTFLFHSSIKDNQYKVYTTTGNTYKELISGNTGAYMSPSISLNNLIVYTQLVTSSNPTANPSFSIYRTDLNNPKSRILVMKDANNPSISPDGKCIAFDNNLGGGISISDISGRNLRKVISNTKDILYGGPVFHPDNIHLLFMGMIMGKQPLIQPYVANIRTLKIIKISTPKLMFMEYSYSPDGKYIVFADRPANSYNSDIYLMKSDGTGLKCIVRNETFDCCPAFSPDGKRIAFSSNRNDLNCIYSVDITGKNIKKEMTIPKHISDGTIGSLSWIK